MPTSMTLEEARVGVDGRPVIHLCNPGFLKNSVKRGKPMPRYVAGEESPGTVSAAQASPPGFMRKITNSRRCEYLAPSKSDLSRVRRCLEGKKSGFMAPETWREEVTLYQRKCENRFAFTRMEHGTLYSLDDLDHFWTVEGGDTMLCSCCGINSKNRTHPCHLELTVYSLVNDGWDVILWGSRITEGEFRGAKVACFAEETTVPNPYDPDPPAGKRMMTIPKGWIYDASFYGWPLGRPGIEGRIRPPGRCFHG